MRVGRFGRLMSHDGACIISVLYSLDANGNRGRLRPLDPDALFPSWLDQGSTLKLHGGDSFPIDIAVTVIKLPRDGWKDDDHFAEFIVRQVSH
jgi:hypothetical protein